MQYCLINCSTRQYTVQYQKKQNTNHNLDNLQQKADYALYSNKKMTNFLQTSKAKCYHGEKCLQCLFILYKNTLK
jgi:hypothetical protein